MIAARGVHPAALPAPVSLTKRSLQFVIAELLRAQLGSASDLGHGGEMLGRLRSYWEQRERSETLRSRFVTVYDQQLWGNHESARAPVRSKGPPGSPSRRRRSARRSASMACSRSTTFPAAISTGCRTCSLGSARFAIIGFDIVRSALARNKDGFPQYEFRLLDITTARFRPPRICIFCKDLLNHLTDEDVKRADRQYASFGFEVPARLQQFAAFREGAAAGRTFGASRHLDITAPPFNYRPPLWTLGEYMSFWRLADMGECGF